MGGATGPEPRTLGAAGSSAAGSRKPAEKDEQELPLIIANMPSTGRQKAAAAGVAVCLIVAAGVIAPFSNIQLGQINGFVPVLQTSLSLVEFITAALLFAQFAIQPQRALLALASGYVFSGSFAFLQTLAFPGGYAPAGVIGDGPNSPAWIFAFWHTAFPAAILVYAFTKDTPGAATPGRPAITAIATTVAGVVAAIAVLTWIVTTKAEYLPSFYLTDVRVQTPLGTQLNIALLLGNLTALAVLLFRGRTILDLWLMVTLLAYSPNFLVAIISSAVRFTVGWYAARCFVLVGSCMLLTVLLIETMLLYSRLASVIALQRRERANRLLSVEAVIDAIAHELRSPLGAIALNADTALNQLRSASRELDVADMKDILGDIQADSHRAAAIVSSIREMTTRTAHQSALTSAEAVAQLTLRLMKHDLQLNEVSVTTDFQQNIPDVQVDGMGLQQVLLNLVRNAIDAMTSRPVEERRLWLAATFDGRSTVVLSVQDSGPGISVEDRNRIFDPFFTTKHDGMGLGLAISSSLVARYGGHLRLAKSGDDGSTFELEIPVAGHPC
jgi:signal transduction histidine kinase